MTNCISGMANAQINKWPMICIAGSVDASLEGKGGF
jgi:thiamine pyrophosphate-dependent acetolactate synthase large subunit-like protein